MSLDATILAVESIAKIQAASYALQVKKNIDLGQIHPNLEVSGKLWSNDEMASRLTVMKDYYCDILEESKNPDSPILVERFRKTFDSPEKLKEIVTRRVSQEENGKSSIHCLQQGDFHFNNLMFKVEADGRTSVKIVDWQMAYTGRAGGDIAYLLMSSINPELYETDEDTIKEKYFDMFNETFYSLIREKKWMNKEEKVEGKEKGGNVHVDLTSSKYFAKHPKAIANPQERSVSQSCQSINRIEAQDLRSPSPPEADRLVRSALPPAS